MTAILGISAFYHDSAAALVVDGEIVAAAQEERFTARSTTRAFPRTAVELLPPASRADAGGSRLRRFLRKAADESSSGCWRPTWPSRRRVPQLPHGDAGVAEGENAPSRNHSRRDRRFDAGSARLHRSPRKPRGQRVLSQPVRRGGDPHARRRGRVEHDDVRRGARQQDPADAGAAVPAFARACCTRRSPTTAASRSTAANTS